MVLRLSCLLSKGEVYVMCFILQLVTIVGFPYDKKFSKTLRGLWSLFPPNVFAAALNYLGQATSTAQDPGIQWKDRAKCSYRSEDCVLTMVIFFAHPFFFLPYYCKFCTCCLPFTYLALNSNSFLLGSHFNAYKLAMS